MLSERSERIGGVRLDDDLLVILRHAWVVVATSIETVMQLQRHREPHLHLVSRLLKVGMGPEHDGGVLVRYRRILPSLRAAIAGRFVSTERCGARSADCVAVVLSPIALG
jgi:hypothetical protein